MKKLRRAQDMTQEELADLLGVSFQSVSRWETGACYPDVEMLPVIADFLHVSIQDLMGLDEARERAEIQAVLDQFQNAISNGQIDQCIAIARNGHKRYPGNYAIMNKLMYALFLSGDDTGNIPEWKANMEKYDDEITKLGERLMKYCPDQAIRLEAMARLAFQHCEMGRKKQGRAIYEMLPGLENAREGQIWWALDQKERAENARELIYKSQDLLEAGIWQLIHCGVLSDAEQEIAAKKQMALDALIQDTETPDCNGHRYVRLARILARQGKTGEAISYLERAVQAARAFDERPECGEKESLLLGKRAWKRSDYETSDSRPMIQILRDSWMQHADFDCIRQTEGFRQLANALQES